MPDSLIIAALIGLTVGHFLNRCIHRLPRNRSVLRPASHCPHCRKPIAWFDNLPVLSYIVLGGRCRRCARPISPRYLVVELVTPALFVYYVAAFGATLHAAKFCVFASILIGLTFSGLEKRIHPDEFTLGGAVLGLILSWFIAPDGSRSSDTIAGLAGLGWSVSGALLPSALLWLIAFLYHRRRGREGLGLGDIKMLAMIGTFLGLGGALFTLAIWFVLVVVVAFSVIRIRRLDPSTYELPTGPLWSIGALCAATVPQARWLWSGMNSWWAWLIGHF